MSDADTVKSQSRDERIGQILNDYLDRKARGEAETQDLLLAKHPDLADELRSHLDLIGEMQPQRSTLQDLIAQGLLKPCDEPGYPARLGAYRISRIIGRGGMGIVLEAYEQSLDRSVALKILRPTLAEDEAALARFKREAQTAAALRHPNIVTVHAVGREGNAHYLAMEYVEGPALGDLIRRGSPAAPVAADLRVGRSVETHPGPLRTEFIREAFRQLLSGLAAAHQAGLIHRDIKSSNILLDEPRASARADAWHHQAELGRGEQATPSATGKEQPALRSDGSLPMPPNVAAGGSSSPDVAAGGSSPPKVAAGGSSPPKVAAGVPAGRCRCRSSGDWLVKIADFGLARMLSARTRMTMTGSVLGTPEYMSPEQARGDEQLDHRTDLYSAGVVLYEMLTGRTPFKADTPSAVIHRILHDDPPDPRTIKKNADRQLASLALRLMAKLPEDRFASAADASAALEAGERIRSPEKRRRFRRHALVGVCTVALLAGGLCALSQFGWQSNTPAVPPDVKPPITRVWIDENVQTRILAEYGDDPTPKIFYDFPAEAIRATTTVFVGLDGGGRQGVVAGTTTPLRGDCLFAFDRNGAETWRMNLSSEMRWPDCPPALQFQCLALAAADLDGGPGDEILASAGDVRYYPTRVSIVNPRTKRIGATFWHMGRLTDVRILPGFFDDGRPAILARGMNNKLDGFGDGLRAGEEQFAHWNEVPVVMILDPNDMDGLGPPRTDRLPRFSAAHVHAYAFLDLANSPEMPYVPDKVPGNERGSLPEAVLDRTGNIRSLEDAPLPVADGTNPWFELRITGFDARGKEVGRAYLTVDRHLRLRRVEAMNETRDPLAGNQAYWSEFWQPIIQNGQYVGKAVGWAE